MPKVNFDLVIYNDEYISNKGYYYDIVLYYFPFKDNYYFISFKKYFVNGKYKTGGGLFYCNKGWQDKIIETGIKKFDK